jgi:adenosine deaminase CECR1
MHLLQIHLIIRFLFLAILSTILFCVTLQKGNAQAVEQSKKEKYLSVRKKLLETDSLKAFDADIKLSNEEKKAEAKLNRLQKQMLDIYKAENYFPPEHNFYSWRDHMYQTELFDILQKMPKAGIHHIHPVTLQNYKWIVDQAVEEEHCYVYWAEDSKEFTKGQLHFYTDDKAPVGFQKAKILYQKIPRFKESLLDLLTFDASSANEDFDTWQEFEKTFQRVGGFYRYEPMFKKFFINAIKNVLEEGVFHLELRVVPRAGLYNLEEEKAENNEEKTILLWKEIETKIREQNPVFSIKIIYTFLRFFDKETVLKEIEKAFELRSKYPEIVKGFDLVAEEDAGNSTLFFLDNWLQMEALEKKYNTDLPLFLHDGESNWVDNDNLYDALILESKRVGHGFNLFRFPVLQEMVKEKDICIEVNPLSNQILDYINDLRIHPAVYYMNNGIQITISPDDPGVFDYTGVTPDYWTAFLAWGLDLRALKKLVYNSIEYSTLDKKEKQLANEHLDKEWTKWITWLNEA